MVVPIMPQGTAIWLIDNTSLTFEQIAKFCGLHILEIQALADEQVSAGMFGVDPIKLCQLTRDEIERCAKDPSATLVLSDQEFYSSGKKSKKKYTTFLKRHERPSAIAWLVKFYPFMTDSSICSLLSTTKSTVLSIRNRTYARMGEVIPRDPVLLGFCTQTELDYEISKSKPKREVEQ